MYPDRQTPPKIRNQGRFRRMGVVNHVSGLKRKGCPGTLTLAPATRALLLRDASRGAPKTELLRKFEDAGHERRGRGSAILAESLYRVEMVTSCRGGGSLRCPAS